jgi:iron(III) transport system ATP-binding protein
LYQHPKSAFVAEFMGDATLLEGIASDGVVRCGAIELACNAALNGSVKVAVRPHAWQIHPTTGLQGTVTALAYQGGHYELTVKTELATVLVNQSALTTPRVGDVLHIAIARGGYAVV